MFEGLLLARGILAGKYRTPPVFFTVSNLFGPKVLVDLDVLRLRVDHGTWGPAVGIGADVASRAGSIVLDGTRSLIARVEILTQMINSYFIADSARWLGRAGTRCDKLIGCSDGDRRTCIAAGDSGDSRLQKKQWSRCWTLADFSVLNDDHGLRYHTRLTGKYARRERKGYQIAAESHC